MFLTLQCPSLCSHGCCAQLWFAPTGVWSFPRAVWVAVLMGNAVSKGCCHQKQNGSICHPTTSTQPTVLRLYLHVYPLKGVSGILHCWFPKGRKKNPAWSRPFEGFKVPWRNAALNRRRQVQLIPGKLRAYQGLSGHGRGGRKDLWPEPKARQLEIYRAALSALISWM